MEALGPAAVLIDTSVVIDHLRQRKSREATLLESAYESFSVLHLSVISLYEVEAGALWQGRKSDMTALEPILSYLDVTRGVAIEAAAIYAELKRSNKLIDPKDILIAATARAHRLPLLTFNEAHFSRVAGLRSGSTVAALLTAS